MVLEERLIDANILRGAVGLVSVACCLIGVAAGLRRVAGGLGK